MHPLFLLNKGSGVASHACRLLIEKIHLFNLCWKFICHFSSVFPLQDWSYWRSTGLQQVWDYPEKCLCSEVFPITKPHCGLSAWVFPSPASSPLNPSITIPSITFKSNTYLAWCETCDGVQLNPQCRNLYLCLFLCYELLGQSAVI